MSDMDEFFEAVEYVPGSVLPDWRTLQKYNRNHRPAGNEHGGEFAPKQSFGEAFEEQKVPKKHAPDDEALAFVFGSKEGFEQYTRDLAGAVTARTPHTKVQRWVSLHNSNIYGEKTVMVKVGLWIHHGGKGSGQTMIQREFHRTLSGELVVAHTNLQVPESKQGHGLSKAVTEASLEHYDKMGVSYLTTLANINVGAYAWARMGFEPASGEVWEYMAQHISTKAKRLAADGHISQLHKDEILKITSERNPRGLWKLSDMRQGDVNVGKLLLVDGVSWDAVFMHNDPATRARSAAFTAVKKGNPNHRPAGDEHGGEFAPKQTRSERGRALAERLRQLQEQEETPAEYDARSISEHRAAELERFAAARTFDELGGLPADKELHPAFHAARGRVMREEEFREEDEAVVRLSEQVEKAFPDSSDGWHNFDPATQALLASTGVRFRGDPHEKMVRDGHTTSYGYYLGGDVPRIVVRKGLPPAQTAATIAHEFGHAADEAVVNEDGDTGSESKEFLRALNDDISVNQHPMNRQYSDASEFFDMYDTFLKKVYQTKKGRESYHREVYADMFAAVHKHTPRDGAFGDYHDFADILFPKTAAVVRKHVEQVKATYHIRRRSR